jgi:hypothetical protein
MSENFEPRNELERALVAAQEDRMSDQELMSLLMTSQLFMPVRDRLGIGGFQSSSRATPLSVKAEDGTDVLVVFTSPDRAKGFLADFPQYQGGLLTDLKWILEKMGTGFGITINPGWPVGLELEPQALVQIARSVPLQ